MDGADPILAEEFLLRRVTKQQLSHSTLEPVPNSFICSKNDTDGLSLFREKYHSAYDVSQFRKIGTAPMYVLRLLASDVLSLNVVVSPDPCPEDPPLPAMPGHALITSLTFDNTSETEDIRRQLATLVRSVHGPFDPPDHAIQAAKLKLGR